MLGTARTLMRSLLNSQLLVLQPEFCSCLPIPGVKVVLGFPLSLKISFSAALWLMPLWPPMPHDPLGNNADPGPGHPSLTLSLGAVRVPALCQEMCASGGWGGV